MNRTLFRPITSRVNVPIRIYALSKSRYTHIVSPSDVIKRRIGLDVALKVDVRSLQDVFRVQAATKGYHCPGYICKEKQVIKKIQWIFFHEHDRLACKLS